MFVRMFVIRVRSNSGPATIIISSQTSVNRDIGGDTRYLSGSKRDEFRSTPVPPTGSRYCDRLKIISFRNHHSSTRKVRWKHESSTHTADHSRRIFGKTQGQPKITATIEAQME